MKLIRFKEKYYLSLPIVYKAISNTSYRKANDRVKYCGHFMQKNKFRRSVYRNDNTGKLIHWRPDGTKCSLTPIINIIGDIK